MAMVSKALSDNCSESLCSWKTNVSNLLLTFFKSFLLENNPNYVPPKNFYILQIAKKLTAKHTPKLKVKHFKTKVKTHISS